jgi:hypothetical protein
MPGIVHTGAESPRDMHTKKKYYFVGIGGSGMSSLSLRRSRSSPSLPALMSWSSQRP